MTGQAAARCARWTVVSILALFVVDIAVPHGAKTWVLAAMALAVVVLLLVLGLWWFGNEPNRRTAVALPGLFAVGVLASIVYLRSLPETAIPLGGVGALVICLVGLAATGLRLRSR